MVLKVSQAAYAQADGDVLYNVKRVEFIELDPATGADKVSGVKIKVDCDSEIALEPLLLEGEVKTLRDSRRIIARAKEEDLLEGMKLTLTMVKFPVTVLPLVQGGTLRMGNEPNTKKVTGYDAPMMAAAINKTPFKVILFVENYKGTAVENYLRFTFWQCEGKAMALEFKKDFFTPKMEVTAVENSKINKPIYSFDYIDSLPTE